MIDPVSGGAAAARGTGGTVAAIGGGGTAAAAAQLVQKVGAHILEMSFLIELSFLKGRDKLKGLPVRSLVVY